MTNKELQIAVENWYANGKPSEHKFTVNGEEYAAFERFEIDPSNENGNAGYYGRFDVFKTRTYTINGNVYEMPNYDPETREPINRIAIITVPKELIAKKKAESEGNTLFEDFFKENI